MKRKVNSLKEIGNSNLKLIKIGEAAKLLGISIDTLRRWERKGWLKTFKTPGGTRFYDKTQLQKLNPNLKKGPKSMISPLISPQISPPPAGESPISLRRLADFHSQEVNLTPSINLSSDQPILKTISALSPETFEDTETQNLQFKDMLVSNLASPFKKLNFKITKIAFGLIFVLVLSLSSFLISNHIKSNQSALIFSEKLENNSVVKTKNITRALTDFFSPPLSRRIFGIEPPGKPHGNLSENSDKPLIPASKRDLSNLKGLNNSGSDPVKSGSVLAESTPSGSFLQINLDTQVNGLLDAKSLHVGNEAAIDGPLTLNTVTYTFPAAQGAASTFLQDDGSGNLTWTNVPQPGNASTTIAGIASFSDSFFTVSTAGAVAIKSGGITTTEILNGTISNSDLASSSITISPGSGISGGGAVSLGGSVTITSVLGSTVNLTSEVEGILPVANGGTGIATTPVAGGVVYGTGSVQAYTAAGTAGQVLISAGSSTPTWGSVSSTCTNCILTDPSSTQTITPTAAGAIGLSIAQASGGTVDIFNVTNNAGTTKYFKVDSSGNTTIEGSTNNTGTFTSSSTLTASNGLTLTTGALNLTSTSGAFSVTMTTTNKATFASSTANSDTIQIQPQSGTATNTFNGIITSSELTVADKTWTFPNANGTVAVSATSPVTLSVLGDIGCSTCLVSGGSLWTAGATSGTTTQTVSQGGTLTFTAGDDITTTGSAGVITIANTSTLATVTGRGATTTTLVNLDGGIAVDTSNFTVSGSTGAIVTASDLTVNGNTTIGNNTSDTLSVFPTTLSFSLEAAHTIQIADSTTADTAGGALTIKGAAGAATNAAGGAINVTGGVGAGSGNGGALVLTGGSNAGSGNGGAITVTAGSATTGTGDGGLLTLAGGAGGSGAGTHDGGGITMTTGNSGSNGTAGNINMNVGTSAGSGNGSINIGTAARNQTITLGNTSNTKTITFDSGVATGTTTTSALALNANALTSGTGLFATSTSITTGKLLDLTTGSANTWTGNGTTNGLVNIASTSTAGTGSSSDILLNIARSGANANSTHTAYGIYSSVTNTGTGAVNVAGYFSANGSGVTNYAGIFAAGNVGIGDTTPSSALEIGDGTDSIQFSSVGDITFVDADGAASITGPAGGAFSVVAGAARALTLTGNLGSTWSTSNGVLTISGDDGLTLTSVSSAGIVLNTVDAIANAFDLQQGSDNYINVNTSDGTENISFGNAVTNPSFSFLGTGAVTIAGSGDGTDALILTAGDLTITNGDFDLVAGDFNVNLDAADTANFSGTAPASVAGNGTDAGTNTLLVTGTAGGASSGTTGQTGGIGGALSLTGGIGGAVAGASGIGGAGGAATFAGGAGGNGAATGGAGGAVSITAGAAGTGGNANGGTLTLNSGAVTGSGTSTLNLGSSNATTVNLATATSATTLNIGAASTTAVTVAIAGGSADTGCTVAGASGNLTCSGTGTFNSVAANNWTRTGSTLSPTTANDIVSIANTNTTGADLAITNTGAYTGTGIFNLTANSATIGNIAVLSGTGMTTGEILDITGTWAPADGSTNEAIDINITHTPTSSADNFRSIDLDTSDGTALGNTVYNLDATLTLTGNAAKTGIGAYSTVTSSSTTGDTMVAFDAASTVSGIIGGATTRSVYGLRSQPTAGAESAAGTTNLYGIYSKAAGDVAVGGTINTYGLYIADGSGDAEGTAANFGLYLEPITGADTNYGICFDCDGTFGTSTVATGIQWGTDANAVTLYRSASDILRTGDGLTVDLDLIVSGGDITGANGAALDVGEATSGDITVTGDLIVADNSFIGLSSTGGLIEFDDQTVDEVNILNANVGIATTAPQTQLSIKQTDADTTQLTLGVQASWSAGVHSEIAWSTSAVAGGEVAAVRVEPTGVGDWGMQFLTTTGGGGSYTPQMTIIHNGNVGIGNTTPAYKLDIATATANDRGINILNSAATGTNYGVYSSVTGAATANYGGYFNAAAASTVYGVVVAALSGATSIGMEVGNLSGATANTGLNMGTLGTATTSTGINMGALSSATSTGIAIGALSGATANKGITVGAISGAGTGTGFEIGAFTNTGATQYGVNIGAFSGTHNGGTTAGITIGNISSAGTTTKNYGLQLGTMTGGTTSNFQIQTGDITAIASATNAGLVIGTTKAVTGTAASSTNYGINIKPLDSTGTANYGLYVDTVAGATSNYSAIFAGTGNVGIGEVAPARALEILRDDATANDSTVVLRLQHTTSGTPAINIGVGLEFEAEYSAGNTRVLGTINGIFDDVSNAIGVINFTTVDNGGGTTEKMRIDGGGFVGIGTTNPSTILHVSTPTGTAALLTAASTGAGAPGSSYFGQTRAGERNQLILGNGTYSEGSPDFTIDSGDNVGINQVSPGSTLHIKQNTDSQGTGGITFEESATTEKSYLIMGSDDRFYVFINGTTNSCNVLSGDTAWTCSSDSRLKDNISYLSSESALGSLSRLKPATFNFKSDPGHQTAGFIAQDILDVFPNAVSTDINGYYGLNYQYLTPFIVKGIQELDNKVNNALLTINQDGLASGNLNVSKITVSGGVTVGGLVSSSNFALDASVINRVGALASVQVNNEGKVTVADALNALSNQQSAISSQVLGLESTEASQSSRISQISLLSQQAVAQAQSLDEKVASTSANLASLSNQIQELLNNTSPNTQGLTPPEELNATGSATLANLNVTDKISTLNLEALDATVSGNLKSLGETFLGNTTIAGDFSVDGTLSVNGNSINSIAPYCSNNGTMQQCNNGVLLIQNSPLAELVNFFNGKVTINKEGQISAESLALGNQSLGEATISAGQTEIAINSSLISPLSHVFITPLSPVSGTLYPAEFVNGQSFKAKLSQPNSEDVKFNWMIIQSKDEGN